MRLGRIGFDNVTGYLDGGMRALEKRADLTEKTDRVTAVALAEWLGGVRPEAGPTPVILDIRSEAEHARGHIEGSLNIPLPKLEDRMGEIPTDRPVVVHCEGGYRSAIGASVLQKQGLTGIHDLIGGYKAWAATCDAAAPAASCSLNNQRS